MVSLMVNGPMNDNQKIEIIKENGDTIVLNKSSEYPLDATGTAGASLPDKSFVICGGQEPLGPHHYIMISACYKLTNGRWELFGKLQTARREHAASSIGHAIWFTGGLTDQGNLLACLPVYEVKSQFSFK